MPDDRPMTLAEQRSKLKYRPADLQALQKETTVGVALGLPWDAGRQPKIKPHGDFSELELSVPLISVGKYVPPPRPESVALSEEPDDGSVTDRAGDVRWHMALWYIGPRVYYQTQARRLSIRHRCNATDV